MVPPRFGVEILTTCEKPPHDDQKCEDKWPTVPIAQLWVYPMNTPTKQMYVQHSDVPER